MVGLEKDEKMIIKLSKEYEYEGKKYISFDLSGLENITSAEMIKAENAVKRNNRAEVLPEMTLEYACYIAHYVTDMPIEFFMQLNVKDAVKVKTAIQGFLY